MPIHSEEMLFHDSGAVVRTFFAELPSDSPTQPSAAWPDISIPLVKGCERVHAIEWGADMRISKPVTFRKVGETLISDSEETRISRRTSYEIRADHPDDMARAHLLDAEKNIGSRLVGSTRKTTTNSMRRTRSSSHTLSAGRNGWIWCAAIKPTTDEEWELWWADLDPGYDHASHIDSPRSVARELGAMALALLGPQGKDLTLTHQDNRKTTHACQTVFHGPVVYVEDPYSYVSGLPTPMERLAAGLFAKRSLYRNQREYRFAVWAEEEPSEEIVDLPTTDAMRAKFRDEGAARPPNRRTRNHGPLDASSQHSGFVRHPSHLSDSDALVAQDDTASSPGAITAPTATPPLSPSSTGDALPSLLDLVDNPSVWHGLSTCDERELASDAAVATNIHAADRVLGQLVRDSGNDPMVASAAWHSTPLVRRLSNAFNDPISAMRVDDSGHIVIKINVPEDSNKYGTIAIGPLGTANAKIGRGIEFTDSAFQPGSIGESTGLEKIEQLIAAYELRTDA